MTINNLESFARFISEHQLQSLDSIFIQLIICVHDLTHKCNCPSFLDKKKFIIKCNALYYSAAQKAANNYRLQFLNKTSERNIKIFLDNKLIAVISA